MTARVTVEMDNAAFDGDDAGPELARILRNLGERVATCERRYLVVAPLQFVCDSNGNTIGTLRISGK